MNMYGIKFLLIISIISFSSNCNNKEFIIKDHAFYLTDTQIKNVNIQEPPKPGSKQDNDDLMEVLNIQEKRTKEQCEEAVSEKHANFEDFFKNYAPFESPLNEEVKDFFKIVKEDTDVAVNYYKNLYKRPRPFLRNKKIKTCFGLKAGGYSYPSGHATISALFAIILSELDTENKDLYFQKANKAALNRVIWGVHYPADIKAGKELAWQIYAQMLQNEDFHKKMVSLKKYLKK